MKRRNKAAARENWIHPQPPSIGDKYTKYNPSIPIVFDKISLSKFREWLTNVIINRQVKQLRQAASQGTQVEGKKQDTG
jgi:hypothetical protein